METNTQALEKPRGRSCCSIWSILILFGLLPVLIYLGLMAVGGILIVGDPLQRADVVVLLGGGDAQRREEAVHLYQDRYATLMVLTETGEKDPKTGLLYSALEQEAVMQMGVPSGGIIFTEQHGNNTYDEAVSVRKLLTPNGRVKSVIIVTDPYHTLRTRLIFRSVFKDSGIQVIIRPVRNHWYRSTTWWQSSEGWRMTIEEYTKVIAYFMGVRKD